MLVMDLRVSDKNLLNHFTADFVKVLDKCKLTYALVSGFVAISHGRARGTEDIDIIIEKISLQKFGELHKDAAKAGFECLQGENPEMLFNDYLKDNLSLRYIKKGQFVPEIELKLSKDLLDEKQLRERAKLPLTGLPFFFSTIETNIAFKEELLKSPKDLEDARHLRIIYSEKLDEGKISEIKSLIRKYRLKLLQMKANERMETVERQALYCKTHMKECQQQLVPFINSQIENANKFYKKLSKTKNGKEKIRQIKKQHSSLLNKNFGSAKTKPFKRSHKDRKI